MRLRLGYRPGRFRPDGMALAILFTAAATWCCGPRMVSAAQPGFDPSTVLPSVVSVLPVWPGYRPPRRPGPGDEPEGTGVVIHAGGYIVTALHIVGRASDISIRLSDGRLLPARLAGRDPKTDLALLKVQHDLPAAPQGPPPKMGDPACAIGNPFGLGLSLSCGVVSATHRSGIGFNRIEDFVQTDTPVNPGSSGGALLDRSGRLIGILSAIFTKNSDANIGVNFAVSMELVRRVIDDLIAHGRVIRGVLGVRLSALPRERQMETPGVLISGVSVPSPAERAGLQTGDIITKVDERQITSLPGALAAIHMHRPGDSFPIEVIRGGARRRMTATLGPGTGKQP